MEKQRPAYAAVAAGRAALPLTRPLKPTAKNSGSSDLAASWEAANWRLSQDMSSDM
jgi:hypothetical protein